MADLSITGYYNPESNNSWVYVKDERYTTAEDFKTAMKDAVICYELATPQTIPQDNLAIASDEGTNNLWCDSGDITVKALDRIIQG